MPRRGVDDGLGRPLGARREVPHDVERPVEQRDDEAVLCGNVSYPRDGVERGRIGACALQAHPQAAVTRPIRRRAVGSGRGPEAHDTGRTGHENGLGGSQSRLGRWIQKELTVRPAMWIHLSAVIPVGAGGL